MIVPFRGRFDDGGDGIDDPTDRPFNGMGGGGSSRCKRDMGRLTLPATTSPSDTHFTFAFFSGVSASLMTAPSSSTTPLENLCFPRSIGAEGPSQVLLRRTVRMNGVEDMKVIRGDQIYKIGAEG